MTMQPGFVDDPDRKASHPVRGPREKEKEGPQTPAAPGFLETGMPGQNGSVDTGWEPETLKPRRQARGSFSFMGSGIVLLLLGWLGLSMIGFVGDQFNRSEGLGVLTLIIFGGAFGLLLRGLGAEARSYRGLRKVDALRRLLSDTSLAPADVKIAAEAWLRSVARHLSEPEEVLAALGRAATSAELTLILRNRVLKQLRQAADQRGRRAAVEGGAAVAITPSEILDGVFAGLRGLALIRQVAEIYGLRPGLAVTVGLMRRVIWTVASVSGAELVSRTIADHALDKVPVLKHLAGAVPGTSLAAIHLYRLAGITAQACSPVADK